MFTALICTPVKGCFGGFFKGLLLLQTQELTFKDNMQQVLPPDTLVTPIPRLGVQYTSSLHLTDCFSSSLTLWLWLYHCLGPFLSSALPSLSLKLKSRSLLSVRRDHQQNSAFLNIGSLKCLSQLALTQMFESQAEFQLLLHHRHVEPA